MAFRQKFVFINLIFSFIKLSIGVWVNITIKNLKQKFIDKSFIRLYNKENPKYKTAYNITY